MARQVWVITSTGSPDSPEFEAPGSEADATEGEGTSGRRFARLRPKGKRHESPVSTPTPDLSPPDSGGMSATPDGPSQTDPLPPSMNG
jgi:hypothetical protein